VPLILLLGLAGGAAMWATRDRTHTYVVPHLVGLTEAEALNQVSEFDWQSTVVREPSDDVAAGVVIRTQPGEATSLQQNKPFQLVVSSGPAPRPLPDIAGLPLEQATAKLTQLGLKVQQADPAFDENIPAGVVISWMVPEQPALKPGDTVTRGTTVAVVVSAGPQPRVVPNLVGLTIEDATAQLAAQNLVLVQVDPQFSDSVAPGLIMAQDIGANTQVPRGSTISVATSKGPDVVPVPALGGLNLQQVTDTLTTAGLTVGSVSGDPTVGVVVAAQHQGVDLLPGQLLPRGAAVDITLG
jgi:serine/threonine-protein kinase